jgi:hypothetical protein
MRLLQRLNTIPFHIAGVICFFLIHGYSENIGLIPFWDLLFFFIIHLLAAALFFGLFMWRLRSAKKAGLLTTLLFLFYLFYGAIADFFKGVSFLSWLSHYRYLLGAFLLGMVFLFRYCKRSAGNFQKITLYLNSVFIFFILYDLVYIAFHQPDHVLSAQNGSVIKNREGRFEKKPDIYFVLMDEYSGSNTLRRAYNYDNSGFENFLKQRGFFVASSPMCNYAETSYSMASILSMDYLGWLKERKETVLDVATSGKIISNNEVVRFLRSKGYELYNFSIFEIGDQPTRVDPGLFSFRLKLITSKTLFSRMEKDLLWILQRKVGGRIDFLGEKMLHSFKAGNENVMQLTKEATQKSGPPKFVYTHLMMPHAPFYDSTGAKLSVNAFDKTVDVKLQNKAYLQYLIYTNKVVSNLINELQEKTKRQAVIILMSDHGYRNLIVEGKQASPVNNFNAVYLPGNNYRYYYDSISNVNQFRVLFNSLFEMQIPLLRDSCNFN